MTVAASSPRATLVLFPGALGDFVCFLPTLAALRARCRDAALVVLVPSSLLSLAVRPGLADRGGALEAAAVARLFVPGGVPPPPLPNLEVGDVYSWFGTRDPTVRDNLARLAAGACVCVPFPAADGDRGHVATDFLLGAGAIRGGPSDLGPRPVLPLRPREREFAEGFWCRHGLGGRAVLAVHRGAGGRAKRWTDDGFAAVSAWWRARAGAVLEIVGPADPAVPLPGTDAVARQPPIGDLAALLARATLFLGNDSGITHLAGAVGARGVALFGPTRARRWRPLGGRILCLTGPRTGGIGAIPGARVLRALEVLAHASLTLTT
jgi:heptosyltransferase-3